MTDLRPHFLTLVAVFSAVLGVVAAVNLAIDSKGALRGADRNWPAAYARTVMESPHGLAWPERQERSVKAELAAASTAECIVVGTSQVQMVRTATFAPARAGCGSLTNLWVIQGTLEDMATMLAAVIDKPQVRKVFVGVSPWLFKWSANSGWTENAEAYARARARFGLSRVATGDAGLHGLANLLNFKYFQANIRSVLAQGGRRPALRAAADEDAANLAAADNVMRPDGSMKMSRVYRAGHPQDWALVSDGSFMIKQPMLQPHAVADLQTMLSALRHRGIDVTLVLAPYHPKVFECRNGAVCAALAQAEATARGLAERIGGVDVLGGYDPRPYGLSNGDFYDDMHLTEAGLEKVFSRR